jgi:hypothetical protein
VLGSQPPDTFPSGCNEGGTMNAIKMPTPREFDVAAAKLVLAGWELVSTIMADDAKKPGVTNFGRLYVKGGERFYLNFKTISNLPC